MLYSFWVLTNKDVPHSSDFLATKAVAAAVEYAASTAVNALSGINCTKSYEGISWMTISLIISYNTDSYPGVILVSRSNIKSLASTVRLKGKIVIQRFPRVARDVSWAKISVCQDIVQRICLVTYWNKANWIFNSHSNTELSEWCTPESCQFCFHVI